MQNTTKAAQQGEKRHMARVRRYKMLDGSPNLHDLDTGRVVRIDDRNNDTGGKRDRIARERHAKALAKFGPDATVYEYRVTFPSHLDVLDHADADAMTDHLTALLLDGDYKLEDVRSGSPFPTSPHAHVLSTVLLPEDTPGVWRFPAPLDMTSTRRTRKGGPRTVWGWYWYTAKPVLAGASRPTTRSELKQLLKLHGDADTLSRQHITAIERTGAAKARAKAQGHGKLPDAYGRLSGGKKKRGKKAA